MSREAWGDDGDAQELPDGCWGPVTVECVVGCIKDLRTEPVYEGGRKENGISTRFLARLTLLEAEADLRPASDPFVKEAEAMFCDDLPLGDRAALKAKLREHGPYPGMAEAFEVRTGVPFDHPDWRDESATWALGMTHTDYLVNRFLAWPLPESVCSDRCASMRGYPHRTGTNLLTADEARQMIEYLLATPSAISHERGCAQWSGLNCNCAWGQQQSSAGKES